MAFRIGQRVAYPNQGICRVENITSRQISESSVEFYTLRVLSNNSLIMVPKDNTGTIGVRPTISATDCTRVLKFLGENFEETEGDWKVRIKDFSCRMQTGDIFDAADVLKKLNHLATQKTLSFREQRLFERARFLVISELSAVCSERECETEKKVDSQLEKSLKKHTLAVAASGFH